MPKYFRYASGLLLTFIVLAISFNPKPAPSPPLNVLFIMVDDLRPEFGAYGKAQAITPHLDAFADKAVVFDRAYTQYSVCHPSRASMLTGLRPHSIPTGTPRRPDFKDVRVAMPGVVSLPEYFRKHGYFTIGSGKIFHVLEGDKRSWSQWHKRAKITYCSPANIKINAENRKKFNATPRKQKSSVKRKGPFFERGDVDDLGYADGRLAQWAAETLPTLKEKKFFLALGFIKPHLPFAVPRRYWKLYNPNKLPVAPNPNPPKGVSPYSLHRYGELRQYMHLPSKGPISTQKAKELVHGYYASVSYVDAQIGKVLNALKENKLDMNTVVVILGDHGWKLGEHGGWVKHTNFEIDTRAPLMVRLPRKNRPGHHTQAVVEFIDIFPTLAELSGLPTPPQLEGVSFVPNLYDPDAPGKGYAVSMMHRRNVIGHSLRTPKYRFTEWKENDKIRATELYDHQTDPHETVNISSETPSNVLNSLSRQLTQVLSD